MAKSQTRILADSWSMGTSFTTDLVDITEADIVFVQLKVTDSSGLDGTFTIESNGFVGDNTTWQTLGNLSTAVSSDGLITFDIPSTAVPVIRVRWQRVTGTANVKIVSSIKIMS